MYILFLELFHSILMGQKWSISVGISVKIPMSSIKDFESCHGLSC